MSTYLFEGESTPEDIRLRLGTLDYYVDSRDFQNFYKLAGQSLTWQLFSLGDQDDVTGWYEKEYHEQTIRMVLVQREAQAQALQMGYWVSLDALGLTCEHVGVYDLLVDKLGRTWEVKTVKPQILGNIIKFYVCDLKELPLEGLTGSTYTESTVEDARYRTKVYLEQYLNTAALPEFIVAYGFPDYPLLPVFNVKNVDLVFSIGEPESKPLIGSNQKVYGYEEHMPIIPCCIDKSNIDGVKLLHQARTELRRVCETYPYGSLREPTSEEPETEQLGSTTLYKLRFMLDYTRDLT
jgi:hypothetical protein